VAFCGRDPERLEAVAGRLREGGGDVLAVGADVTQPAELSRLMESVVARWGRLDGLVNNAGRGAAMPLVDSEDAHWRDDLDLKLMAAVRLTRLAVPHLRAHGGAIVNTLNTSSKTPGPNSGPSSVSRAAGLALTKALSKELGPQGIRVNAVCNGLLESPQWEKEAAAEGIPVTALYERLHTNNRIPLGRVGHSREYADVVTFLLSDRASYVNGVALNIDGGMCALA
jgi:NAD(P)-dependent dehydrogenase (short-subunit alcohol dehydrogenase family)